MKHSQRIAISLFFLTSTAAQAAVEFNCYALNGLPMQSFELGSINCPDGTRKRVTGNGNTDVLCVYNALCQPLAPKERPTQLTVEQVASLQTNYPAMAASSFKPSIISCAGQGQVTNGNLTYVNCPPPNVCRRDILYNINFAPNLYPGQNAVVPQPHVDKGAQ